MPQVGFYGDDVTGSVDALLQFRRAGLPGVLVVDVDDVETAGDHSVVGIAGISRSLPTDQLEEEVGPALATLAELGPDVVQYKACSTVDSSPEIGSLGRVIEIARRILPPLPIPMIFAQPDFGRYTIFGQHFATDGDRVHRLDRHPTMANHPVTPIDEAELARLIGRQTGLPIGAVAWTEFDHAKILRDLINTAPEAAVVCDAFTEEHLVAVARAVLAEPTRPRFMIGSGGLSLGVGLALGDDRARAIRQAQGADALRQAQGAEGQGASGRTVALSGSCSGRTREQVESAMREGWQALDLFRSGVVERATRLHRSGTPVVVHSLDRPLGTGRRSAEIPDRLAEVADACLAAVPETRLISCGGDTSGALLRRIGTRQLIIEAEPWGNVALCRATLRDGRSFELVLKGGQMGHPELFHDVCRGHPH